MFQTDTTVEFRANYSEKTLAHLNFIYNDNIANGSGSWSNTDRFIGYTHTFNTPPDIPNHYEQRYWNGELEKKDTFRNRVLSETPKFVQKKMSTSKNESEEISQELSTLKKEN